MVKLLCQSELNKCRGRKLSPVIREGLICFIYNKGSAPKRKGKSMSDINKYLGLCSTCKNTATCSYPRALDRPISFCCEHEGYEECEGSVSLALLKSSFFTQRFTASTTPSLSREGDISTDKGLCKICENLGTCNFQKPEGGVWHCDEYR